MFTRLLTHSLPSPRPFFARPSFRTYTTKRLKSPNEGIVNFLGRCLDEEESSPNRNGYKVRSFQIAISALRQVQHEITSGQEAMKLRGIGAGIAERIDMHLQGKEYDPTSAETSARAKAQLISNLRTVPGLGERTAAALVEAGVKSVFDLNKPQFSKHLTAAQKVGVTYAVHVERPIPREEAEIIAAFIRDHISSNFEVIVTGSYRLGAEQLSEVEILLLHPSHVHVPLPDALKTRVATSIRGPGALPMPFRHGKSTALERRASPLLQDAVHPLMDTGLLAAALSASASKWQGVALLPTRDPEAGRWREAGDRLRDLRASRGHYMRLDLNLAPIKSKGAALLALTGDSDFYRHARATADRIGMRLNEYGLWKFRVTDDMSDDPEAEGKGYWELVASETEESILEELNLGWVDPARRNFRFLKNKPAAKSRKRSAQMDLNKFVLENFTPAGNPPDKNRKRGRPRKETEPAEEEEQL